VEATLRRLGQRLIRTVWLATICLAVFSALAVGKAVRAPANTIFAEAPTGQMTVGTGLAQDTLSKADRLEITHARPELPTHSALQPTEPPELLFRPFHWFYRRLRPRPLAGIGTIHMPFRHQP
jgi:hypothetical protein